MAGDGSADAVDRRLQSGNLGDENLESGDFTAFIGIAGLGLVKQVAGIDMSVTAYPLGPLFTTVGMLLNFPRVFYRLPRLTVANSTTTGATPITQ